jgi:hypothetical protein
MAKKIRWGGEIWARFAENVLQKTSCGNKNRWIRILTNDWMNFFEN